MTNYEVHFIPPQSADLEFEFQNCMALSFHEAESVKISWPRPAQLIFSFKNSITSSSCLACCKNYRLGY